MRFVADPADGSEGSSSTEDTDHGYGYSGEALGGGWGREGGVVGCFGGDSCGIRALRCDGVCAGGEK